MKRLVFFAATLALVGVAPASAETRTYFGFQIGITNAPPPPQMVFEEAPHVVAIPSSRVYVVEDDDLDYDAFRYGTYWYVCDHDYWYRARDYRGPFRIVDVRYVPRQILYVPEKHWRHHHGHDRNGWGREKQQVVVYKVNEKHKHGHGHDDD